MLKLGFDIHNWSLGMWALALATKTLTKIEGPKFV
jgi:hypothetical protein